METCKEYAKNVLWHYLKLIADKSGVDMDSDCKAEIEGIVDAIVWAATDDMRKELKNNGR